MYQALEKMGVHPDTVLEPAMGVGNFFGLLPESMQDVYKRQVIYPGVFFPVLLFRDDGRGDGCCAWHLLYF